MAGEVFVGEGFGGVECFFVGVEFGVDVVGDYAGGERFPVGGVGGDAGLRSCLSVQGEREEERGYGESLGARHTGIVGGVCGLERENLFCFYSIY